MDGPDQETIDEFKKDTLFYNRLEFNAFNPQKWKELREDIEHHFKNSVDMLANREKLGPAEAESKLLNIMIKLTFIEQKLAVHGKKTAIELFELQNQQNKENPITLFESADEIDSFCNSMSPVFFRDKLRRQYRNTGIPYRKLCQYLQRIIALGDVVDEDTVDDIIDNFQKENVVKYKEFEKFQKEELFLDFDSLVSMGALVPGFRFDSNEERLYTSDDVADRLPFHLPIFLNLIGYNHRMRRDFSRWIRCYVKFTTLRPDAIQRGIVFGHGVMDNFKARFDRRGQTEFPSPTGFGKGCLILNDPVSHVEMLDVVPCKFSMHNNHIAYKTASLDTSAKKSYFSSYNNLEKCQTNKNKNVSENNE